jgi:glycosyltransferase involved in cell wall biosynthesis
MRVTVVDPPAYTPPYDHALCAALGRRGVDVELATSRFRYSAPAAPAGYRLSICFYGRGGSSALAKAAQHPFDMARLARRAKTERRDVVHFQWLPVPPVDRWLLRLFERPLVLTAHDILPREAGAIGRRAWARLLGELDAVVVHSGDGRRRLVEDLGLAASKVHVIPHGAFDHLTRPSSELPLDPAVGQLDDRRVVLFFGLVRPYKGLDLLIEAFASTQDDAVLLVVGMPRTPIDPLRERARRLGIESRVRFVPRFVPDAEIPGYFRRADLVVLPYREAEQSGVVSTALAFGTPLLLSAVGGFVELAERHGAARLVPPGEVEPLRAALVDLLEDDAERGRLALAARRAAEGPCSWDRAAELTLDLYESLTASTT